MSGDFWSPCVVVRGVGGWCAAPGGRDETPLAQRVCVWAPERRSQVKKIILKPFIPSSALILEVTER